MSEIRITLIDEVEVVMAAEEPALSLRKDRSKETAWSNALPSSTSSPTRS